MCEKLGNWRFDFFDNDSDSLIPTCIPVSTVTAVSIPTVSNTEANFHFPSGNPATVAFYVGGTVNVNVNVLVQHTINGSGILALRTVKSKIPPLTATCTPCYPDVTHVNHTKVWITSRLDKVALLKPIKTNQGECMRDMHPSFIIYESVFCSLKGHREIFQLEALTYFPLFGKKKQYIYHLF